MTPRSPRSAARWSGASAAWKIELGRRAFTSAPVAALELALLMGGAGFLLYGDALVTLASALLARLPGRLAAGIVALHTGFRIEA